MLYGKIFTLLIDLHTDHTRIAHGDSSSDIHSFLLQ